MIIGRRFKYLGSRHAWAKGLMVKVIAVHRGEEILRDDAAVGDLQPEDIVEFAPWIEAEARFSWVTSDAHPGEIVPMS